MNKLVTLDQAMKLKKFRFDLLTEFQYHNTELVKLRKRNEDDEFYISAPMVDDALDWIRENKGIMCAVELEPIIEHFRITGCEYKGIIVEDRGNYIGVNFYDSKPENIVSLHPTWEIEYLGIGKVRKVSKARMKAKQRYEEYRSADYFSGSFADWLGIKSKKTF